MEFNPAELVAQFREALKIEESEEKRKKRQEDNEAIAAQRFALLNAVEKEVNKRVVLAKARNSKKKSQSPVENGESEDGSVRDNL